MSDGYGWYDSPYPDTDHRLGWVVIGLLVISMLLTLFFTGKRSMENSSTRPCESFEYYSAANIPARCLGYWSLEK